MFGYDIVALISKGKTESVDDIIKHFGDGDVVRYVMDKYRADMSIITSECTYNLDEWEEVFKQYYYMEYAHDVRRKMGIMDEEKEGFLMLLTIILIEVSGRRYK